ncbi:MAG: glycosyl hydrolase family 28 protein [Candidatus Acidiferrales bacterium]
MFRSFSVRGVSRRAATLRHCVGCVVVLIMLALGAQALRGQDTRTVTEPTIPPTCVVLTAEKLGHAEILPPEYETTTDTARIQNALDTCKPGEAVELALGAPTAAPGGAAPLPNAFLTGSIELRDGVTLLVDKGVTLYASRDPKDFDPDPSGAGPLLCGTMSAVSASFVPTANSMPQGRFCKPLIAVVNVKNAAIMGDGIIDDRGGAVIVGHDYTWWQMARAAEPKQQRYFSQRMIVARNADGFVLYRITLHNSANFHVSVGGTNGFTAWGVHLQTPTVAGTDARNTDGIDPGSSTNITITKSWIDNGDDNIAIKTGVTHMSVLDNHFYSGHGMSIGSETNTGDSFLLVDGLTEDHTTSGIRIKSNAARGGLVHDLVYRNICMRNVPVPIAISPFYNNQTIEGFTDPGITGNLIPDYKAITLQNVTDTTAGDVLIAGKDADHITEVTLDGVIVNGITPAQVHSQFSHITVTGRGTNLQFSGTGVTVTGQTATSGAGLDADVQACAAKFVPME